MKPRDGIEKLEPSLRRLDHYVQTENYEGFDPYDALGSPFIRSLSSSWLRLAFTQLFVYSPINLRRAFKVAPGKYPKGVALFLSSYCNMYHADLIGKDELRKKTDGLTSQLMESYVKGYHGLCWGVHFDIQGAGSKSINPARTPSIIHAAMVGDAFFDLYEITKEGSYLDAALSASDFIVKDLNVLEDERGICFSYRPTDRGIVHNGNVIGAAFLSRAYTFSARRELLDLSKKAVDFTIAHQEDDGSWAYSMDARSCRKRYQTDFHQGFIINALIDFINHSGTQEKRYGDALRKAATFYRERQFEADGRSWWRLPWRWPADIHHQAQGISTFGKLWHYDERYLTFACKIAAWTMENMQDPSGYFYFQKYPFGANRISYMRWSQAWMMFSISYLLRCIQEREALNSI